VAGRFAYRRFCFRAQVVPRAADTFLPVASDIVERGSA
jgi:hypothetical protein